MAKGKKSPALRRSTRNANKGRPNDSYTPNIEAPKTPATSFTPTTLSGTIRTGTSTTPSSPLQYSPTKEEFSRLKEIIAKFHYSFPNSYKRENVSSEGLLCGLWALSCSVELYFGGIIALIVEEFYIIAQSDEMASREKHITIGNGVRLLDKDYSVDQLANIL